MKQEKKPKTLQEKLEEKKKQLIFNSKDAHFAKTLIGDLLALQAQKDIEPTELHVPVSDVVETIDYDSVQLKVCKTGILFHAKSGFSSWIEPRCLSLFSALIDVLTERKKYSEMTEEELNDPEVIQKAENVRMYMDAWMYMLQMPVGASVNPMILFPVVTSFLKAFREQTEQMLNKPLHEETVSDLMENAEADRRNELLDGLAEHYNNQE